MTPRLFALVFAVFIVWAWPAAAQTNSAAPSGRLTPYEEQLYGDQLWKVPRDPYERDFGQYKARSYIPPEDETSFKAPSSGRSRGSGTGPMQTDPAGIRPSDKAVKRRFQTEMKFREDQRKIGERSRIGAPQVPSQHRVYGPGQTPAIK